MKMYDYFNGTEWQTVSEEWLEGVDLDGLKEVYIQLGGEKIKCVYESGKEVYYQNIFGTWGFPVVFT